MLTIKCIEHNVEYIGQDFWEQNCKDCPQNHKTTVTATELRCPHLVYVQTSQPRNKAKAEAEAKQAGAQASVPCHIASL